MYSFPRRHVTRSGFSLVELLVVISIIGLLSVITSVTVSNVRKSARDTKRMGDMRQLATALDMYSIDNAAYPPCADGNSMDAGSSWYTCLAPALSTYMAVVPVDPGGSSSYGYNYSTPNGKIVYLRFGLENNTPSMANASFGFYNSAYSNAYIYSRTVGYY